MLDAHFFVKQRATQRLHSFRWAEKHHLQFNQAATEDWSSQGDTATKTTSGPLPILNPSATQDRSSKGLISGPNTAMTWEMSGGL